MSRMKKNYKSEWIPFSKSSNPSIHGKYRIIQGRHPKIEVEYMGKTKSADLQTTPELALARLLLAELSQQGNEGRV